MLAGDLPALVHDGACPVELIESAQEAGWKVLGLDGVSAGETVGLVLTGAMADVAPLRRRFPGAFMLSTSSDSNADLLIPPSAGKGVWARLLCHAERVIADRAAAETRSRELAIRHDRIRQLADIGLALSNEQDPARLLSIILSEGRRLAACEAGSLYLIDVENAAPCLVFKLAQNDSVAVSLQEARLPLASSSLSGYVAITGQELNIADAYAIPPDRGYRFNPSFDDQTGYRTRSLLVIPMRDHRGQVVGVLQFINRIVDGAVVAFDEEITELLRAVASQAAVAIQKNALIRDIRTLFESFVQASVKAIEQRDPSTSGHSFRVAEYTTQLLEALPRGSTRFRDLTISADSLTEVRYAALLHDFGKVGVREAVLVKANKLTDERLEVIRYRFELQKERLRRAALEEEMELLHHGADDFEVGRRRIHRALAREIATLDDFFGAVVQANNPNVLAQGDFTHLDTLRARRFLELDGSEGRLVSDADVLALSVRKGSLTPAERLEIQDHVRFTRDFLAVLPWPPELARVPLIAAAHHEKLNGSGYPLGLKGDEIPLASRVMTVCDIYDALTAMDRPYKPALSAEAALRILDDEAASGMLDGEIVRIFVESGVYRIGGRGVSGQKLAATGGIPH